MLLNIEGFDNGRAPGLSGSGNVSNALTTGRVGGQSWRAAGFSGNSAVTISYWPPGVPAQLDGAMGFAAIASGPLTTTTSFLQLRAGGTELIGIRPTGTGTLAILVSGTQVAETVAIDSAVWNHYDFRFTIAGAGAGKLQLAINDEQVCDLSGLTFTTVAGVSNLLLTTGAIYNNRAVQLDDVYVADATGPAPYNGRLGDCKVELLRPNAQGAVAEWVGSDGNSVDNWALIDDAGATADWIGSGTPGALDLSQLANPTGTNLGVVYATQAEVMAAKSDAGAAPGDVQLVERSQAGTDQLTTLATPAQLSTTYQWFVGPVRTADPDGDPWTVERLDNLQVGVKVSGP